MIPEKKHDKIKKELLTDVVASAPKRIRGMNRGREKAMAKAKKEVKIVRLCNSIYRDGSKCKFGNKCSALHSLSEFWEKRSADLGNNFFYKF